MKTLILLVLPLVLCGCAVDPRDIGREPRMTPVGAGLNTAAGSSPILEPPGPPPNGPVTSLWEGGSRDLFRDQRAVRVGDIITVAIAINDKAVFGNASDRSREDNASGSFAGKSTFKVYPGSADASYDAKGKSDFKGSGNINRSEQIQLSVAAVVTHVYPNGNLYISGSQEVRVNYELRELQVAGIVRPFDVARDNTIAYDKIAEARISYGGRGRIMEVMQPTLVHQLFDLIKPF